MCKTKIFYSFAITGLVAFSSVATATVYDFGKIKAVPSASGAQYSSYADDEFVNSMNFDFTSVSTQNGLISGNQGGHASIYSTNVSGPSGLPNIDSESQFRRGIHNKLADDDWSKRSDKYVTVTSPVPEPETYAMMLAGLALIGFTARRRSNQN